MIKTKRKWIEIDKTYDIKKWDKTQCYQLNTTKQNELRMIIN